MGDLGSCTTKGTVTSDWKNFSYPPPEFLLYESFSKNAINPDARGRILRLSEKHLVWCLGIVAILLIINKEFLLGLWYSKIKNLKSNSRPWFAWRRMAHDV